MSIIQISKLSFTHDGSWTPLFNNVNLRLDSDWKLGFIGRNGRGKTTLLKLLLGKYHYQGQILASVQFDYFPFDIKDRSVNTRKALEAVSPRTPVWKVEKELSLLNVSKDVLDRPFETLSNGEQTKALLASLFSQENHFLLIDEPTNHLDLDGRKAVANYLNSKKGFIVISHDRAFLDACIDHVLSINRNSINVQKGNFSSWWQNKAAQDQFELGEDQKLQKEVRKLKFAIQRTANWSDEIEKTKHARYAGDKPVGDRGYIGHMAAKMMARSKAIDKRRRGKLEEKEKLLKEVEEDADLKLNSLPFFAKNLVDLEDVSIDYGTGTILNHLSFRVQSGERVALVGKNGCGKSSLLKMIIGEPVPHWGRVSINPQLKISYLPQDASSLKGSLYHYIEKYQLNEKQFKIVLSQLEIPHTQFDLPMETFSLGQKKKVMLARSLCEPAHLYIWDEALNYIDIISRMQLEKLLIKVKPSMLFVEHDQQFCENIATKSIVLT